MANKTTTTELVIFKSSKGQVKLRGDFRNDTLWATQADIAEVFSVTPQNVTLHIKNIYKDNEPLEGATCKESLQVQKEGVREVTRTVKLYNLDVIKRKDCWTRSTPDCRNREAALRISEVATK